MTLRWLAQTLHWTVIAVSMRAFVVGCAWQFRDSLGRSAVMLGSWACTRKEQNVKTFINIIFLPVIFDAIQVRLVLVCFLFFCFFVCVRCVSATFLRCALHKSAR